MSLKRNNLDITRQPIEKIHNWSTTEFPVRNVLLQFKCSGLCQHYFESCVDRQQHKITQTGCDYLTGPPAGMGQVGKSHGQFRACGRHCLILVFNRMSSSACTISSALQHGWTVSKWILFQSDSFPIFSRLTVFTVFSKCSKWYVALFRLGHIPDPSDRLQQRCQSGSIIMEL